MGEAGKDNLARISAARSRLILDRPFLGALVMRLPMQETEASWCPTTATDARKIYFNPSYFDSLSLSQIEFALAHEALHCALAHFARRLHRDKRRWDIACDFAVNPLLIDDGLTPPPDVLYMPDYAGLSAEEIYPMLEEDSEDEPHDRHLYDDDSQDQETSESRLPDSSAGLGADPAPPEALTPDERTRLEQQWQERLAGAAQQAAQAGKLSGTLARLVDQLIAPTLPWRQLLARYMSMRSRDDFDYARPGRREGEAILPALRSGIVDVAVAVDTSGSVSTAEMSEFVNEVDALKGQVKARVSLVYCDSELAPESPRVYEPWEQLETPESLSGGGGTDFSPVFQWAESLDMAPDLLIYFTDAKGRFPDAAPTFPVIWLVKGSESVPFGERIQLN